MILFKSCPKCGGGDLAQTVDMFGTYLQCIQCGFTRDYGKKGLPLRNTATPNHVISHVDRQSA